MTEKPQWMNEHEASDNKRFDEINQKLDSILELMSAFKLGWKGVTGVIGFLVAVGTLIVLGMKITGK